MAKLQKVNTKRANALTVFPIPAAPSTSYTLGLMWADAGATTTREVSHKEGEGRRHDRPAPSATSTRPAKVCQELTVSLLDQNSSRRLQRLSDCTRKGF